MYKGWQQVFLIGVFLFFLWSFFLRFYELGRVPNGLYWDETAILLDARSLAETGKDMHGRPWYQVIFPSYGDYKLPVYIWLASVSVKILGSNEFAVRLPSAFAGLITIGAAALLVYELLRKDEKTEQFARLSGLLTALVLALSPWSILFSRTGFEAHLGQALLVCSLLAAVMSRQKKWLILVSPVLGLLATYSYFSVRYVWLSSFILLSALFLIEFKFIKSSVTLEIQKSLLFLIIPVVLFCVGLWPMMHSPLYQASNAFRLSTNSVLHDDQDIINSNIYREISGNQRVDRAVFSHWWLTTKNLLSNYSDNVSLNYLFLTGDPNLRHGTQFHGLFPLIAFPFFCIGWLTLFRHHKRVFFFFVFWWLFALLPASVPNTTPHALRSLNALAPLASVIGLGMAAVLMKCSQQKPLLLTSATVVFFLFWGMQLLQFTQFYFYVYPLTSYSAWQGGFKQLASNAYQMRKGEEDIYVLNFDDRFYLWMLLYGPYSSEYIQKLSSKGYQMREFDHVFLDGIPDKKSESALVIGTTDQLQSFMAENNYVIVTSQKVPQSPQTEFEVARLEKK